MFRIMERAKQHFKYRLYEGLELVKDDDGLYTGEDLPKYSAVKDGWQNINGATGKVNREDFGAVLDYQKVMMVTGYCPFDEHTQFWIDDLDADEPDYVVKRINRSQMGVCRIALAKVHTES